MSKLKSLEQASEMISKLQSELHTSEDKRIKAQAHAYDLLQENEKLTKEINRLEARLLTRDEEKKKEAKNESSRNK